MTKPWRPPSWRNWGSPTRLAWLAAFLLLFVWVSDRLGGFDLTATIERPDGTLVTLPNTFATVDHPFHAARAETFRQSLASGEMLRWVGSHQGGYPTEFYPLGAAGLEVALWATFLGTLSMLAIHKLTIILVLFAPVIGFYLLARYDRAPIGVAFLAICIHVSVRGWWWSGGPMELVEWGLLTNVAAMTVMPVALAFAARYVSTGNLRVAALFAFVASFAVYTNTRSTIALAVIALAVLLGYRLLGQDVTAVVAIKRMAILTFLTACLSAPQILSLIRFGDLYFFVRYETYASFGEFFNSSVRAVSSPVFVAGVVGVALVLLLRRQFSVSAVAAITLIFYMTATVIVAELEGTAFAIEQLEPTRLMPFQRLLMIYIASVGLYAILRRVIRQPAMTDAVLGIVGVGFLISYVIAPIGIIPESDRGLVDVPTTGQASFDDLRQSVELADETAEPGTAILILGTVISWHDQLWAPTWSDRRFFYNDWLWYWQTDHWGEYNPEVERAYPNPASPLTPEYLERHGIGAVVVTGPTAEAASVSPHLRAVRDGLYRVYDVVDPTTIVTAGGRNAADFTIQDHRLAATLPDGEPVDPVTFRHNWFPRWTADDNLSVVRRDDGYLDLTGAMPSQAVELRYEITGWDWLGRLIVTGTLVISLALVAIPNRADRLVSRVTRSTVVKPRDRLAHR